MGCLRKTKKVIKAAAKAIGPLILAAAGRAVNDIEAISQMDPEWWTSDKKRRAAVAIVEAEAERLKRSVPTHLINLAIEHAVAMLNDADPDIGPGDLGDADEGEIEAA